MTTRPSHTLWSRPLFVRISCSFVITGIYETHAVVDNHWEKPLTVAHVSGTLNFIFNDGSGDPHWPEMSECPVRWGSTLWSPTGKPLCLLNVLQPSLGYSIYFFIIDLCGCISRAYDTLRVLSKCLCTTFPTQVHFLSWSDVPCARATAMQNILLRYPRLIAPRHRAGADRSAQVLLFILFGPWTWPPGLYLFSDSLFSRVHGP